MPIPGAHMLLTLLVLFLAIYLLRLGLASEPETEEVRTARRKIKEREMEVRAMLDRTYHRIAQAVITKSHLKEIQEGYVAILAVIVEVEVANLNTAWQSSQGGRQTLLGRSETDVTDEMNFHMARQTVSEMLSTYIELEGLLDGAVEKLRVIQGDLNWFLMVEGLEVKLRQTGRSKYKTMSDQIDLGQYRVDIMEESMIIQLAVNGLRQ